MNFKVRKAPAAPAAPLPHGRWHVRLSRGIDDPLWACFIEDAPGGHYTQTVAWARFRAAFGWETARATVWRDGQLVAGSQVLLRPVRGLGSIGYVPHGPVVAGDHENVIDLALASLLRLCRREQVRYLMLRPSSGGRITPRHLQALGLRRNDRLEKAPLTARVDLAATPEEILARMRKSTRANVRRGHARGLTARRGNGADLDTLLRLYRMAAVRKGFPRPSVSRYRQMWRSLEAEGRAQLFLVEDDHEAVAAQLAIRCGETLYSHVMAWNGEHAKRKPNELLDWTAMMWAKDHQCRYYDFEGVGDAAMDPDRAPNKDAWVSDYKYGFGAEVVPTSFDYEYVLNPLLRWGHTRMLPRIEHRSAVRRLDRRLQRVLAGRAGSDGGASPA